jgi:flagellar biosynthesis protein FlhF
MNVRKFEGNTFEEALSRVKAELGSEALILSTEEKRRGWMQKPTVEITAAFTQAKEEHPDLESIFPHRRVAAAAAATELGAASERQRVKPAPQTSVSSISAQKVQSAQEEASRIEKSFLGLGLSLEVAKDFARQIAFDYSKKDRGDVGFLDKVKSKLLSGGIKTLGADIFNTRRAWSVLGMPGAGKTSLLVKLGLILRSCGHNPHLSSCDVRKVVARREMMAYAKLAGLQYSHYGDLRRLSSQVVLLDTPSVALSDRAAELEVESNCRDLNTLIVLDSTARVSEQVRTVERWSRLAPVALAFTKLDIAADAGAIYDVLRATKLPLLGVSLSGSFQDPFHFLDPAGLARLILRKPSEESRRNEIIQAAALGN